MLYLKGLMRQTIGKCKARVINSTVDLRLSETALPSPHTLLEFVFIAS